MMLLGGEGLMKGKATNMIFGTLIALSVFGLFVLLLTNPMSIVRYLIITAIIVGIFVLIFTRFIMPRATTGSGIPRSEHRAFLKAARQSQKRYRKDMKQSRFKKNGVIRKRRLSRSHLTVIDGKKGKKKNRAMH